MGPFLNAVVPAIISVLANVVYFDMKRKGVRGWGRFFAFVAGNPMTWITFFFVHERPVVGPRVVDTFQPPEDDDQALLAEIRRDRALRDRSALSGIGPHTGSHEAPPDV